MSAVIVGIDAAYWNTNRKDSSLACCESPNLWRSTIMICAVGMPDEMRSTARPRRAWGIGIIAVASASRPLTIAGTKRSLTMTKPEMMPRTAYTAAPTERFAGGGGGASASLALFARLVGLDADPWVGARAERR